MTDDTDTDATLRRIEAALATLEDGFTPPPLRDDHVHDARQWVETALAELDTADDPETYPGPAAIDLVKSVAIPLPVARTAYDTAGEKIERIETVLDTYEAEGLTDMDSYEQLTIERGNLATLRGLLGANHPSIRDTTSDENTDTESEP